MRRLRFSPTPTWFRVLATLSMLSGMILSVLIARHTASLPVPRNGRDLPSTMFVVVGPVLIATLTVWLSVRQWRWGHARAATTIMAVLTGMLLLSSTALLAGRA